MRRVCALAVVALSAALLTSMPAAGGSQEAAGSIAPGLVAPLSGSISTASVSAAVVQMGRNDGHHDLFWQLFTERSGSGRWRLATPPGVADNGGLVVSGAAPASVLVGFGASAGLTFSPMALSDDAGANWSPGGLPDRVVTVPSAVALGGSDRAAALVAGTTTEVLGRHGSLTNWSTVTSTRSLASVAAAKSCGVGAIHAVDLDPNGRILLGTSCARPGVVGLFTQSGSGWRLANLPVPRAATQEAFTVLRIGTVGSTVGGLLAGISRNGVDLYAAWGAVSSEAWAISRPLAIGTGAQIVASGDGPNASQFVIVRTGASQRAEVVTAPGSRWQSTSELPTGTATIAIEPNGVIDALVVADTTLTVLKHQGGGTGWSKTETVNVPIVFGSSE